MGTLISLGSKSVAMEMLVMVVAMTYIIAVHIYKQKLQISEQKIRLVHLQLTS